MTSGTQPRIVAIGGGTGSPTVIEGLMAYDIYPISISTMFDSGGSSGELRDAHGVLPPGDIRRAILAHHQGDDEGTLRSLFAHRFAGNSFASRLNDHVVGNIITAAAEEMWGRQEALRRLTRLFNIRGEVWPVSIDDANLVAILDDGDHIYGETNIDCRSLDDKRAISRVELRPQAFAYASAVEAIRTADLIVLGPGEGVSEALHTSRGRIVYVVNVMTKHGETGGYTAVDFVRHLTTYGIGPDLIDTVVVNTAPVPEDLCARYLEEEKAEPVRYRAEFEPAILQYAKRVVAADLLSQAGCKKGLIRHDPRKLGQTLMAILAGMSEQAAGLWILDLDDTLTNTTRDLCGDPERLEQLTLADGARDFLERHRGSLVLVTQERTPGLQRRKLEHLGIAAYFREIQVVANERDKALAIMEVVRTSGLSAGAITVIGDRIDNEIAVAKAIGCRAVRMCFPEGRYANEQPRGPREEPDHCVASWSELNRLF